MGDDIVGHGYYINMNEPPNKRKTELQLDLVQEACRRVSRVEGIDESSHWVIWHGFFGPIFRKHFPVKSF